MPPHDSKRSEPPPCSPDSPAKEDRTTKKVRLKDATDLSKASHEIDMDEAEGRSPLERQPSICTDSTPVQMGFPPLSYKDKLATGTTTESEEEFWIEEEEPEFEEGDVIVREGENGPVIELSKAFKKRLDKPWQSAVVVKLLGRPIGYKALKTKLQSMWKTEGLFRLIDMENDFYVVRFRSNADYIHALTEGPWTIFGHALCVQPWSPGFRETTGKVEQDVVWVRFPDLSLNRYHSRILKVMGNLIGKAVKVDYHTEKTQRGKFAKMAVVVDLTKPLKGTLNLEGETIKVGYEGLPHICYFCGRYGHNEVVCSEKKAGTTTADSPAPLTASSSGEGISPTHQASSAVPKKDLGHWMTVAPRQRRPNRKISDETSEEAAAQSMGNVFGMVSPHPSPLKPVFQAQPSTQPAHKQPKPRSSRPKPSNTPSPHTPKPNNTRPPLKDISNAYPTGPSKPSTRKPQPPSETSKQATKQPIPKPTPKGKEIPKAPNFVDHTVVSLGESQHMVLVVNHPTPTQPHHNSASSSTLLHPSQPTPRNPLTLLLPGSGQRMEQSIPSYHRP
ncbi:hypothetical protein Tsubulata_043031 [Turnera subulata]|uniref:DUF4283 domain-containing protein n=1 Tax=Turnera subulata TaxID=218843 RepID=A0A9Q0FUW0_9ROSI|nr:hypothetical protein Tsubulata_043031 [Turnera subulata]